MTFAGQNLDRRAADLQLKNSLLREQVDELEAEAMHLLLSACESPVAPFHR